MNPKKILIIGDYFSGHGGTEKVLHDFYWHFYKKYDIGLLCIDSDINERQWLNDINDVHFLNVSEYLKKIYSKNIFLKIIMQLGLKKLFKNSIYYKLLKKSIASKKPDLIISTSYVFLKQIRKIISQEQLNCKVVYWDHMANSYYLKNDKLFLNNIYQPDYYFAISSGIKNSLSNLNISHEKLFLIYNPISAQSENKFSLTPIKFIYIGRLMLEKQKRCLDIIHAVKIIEHLDFSVELYGDGEERALLEKEVKKLNLMDKISFKGWVNNPWHEINQASCLLLSSQYEGFGLVLAEAISYGIPVISSNCKYGPEDIILPQINGQLYATGDIQQLASSMALFIKQPSLFYQPAVIKSSIEKFYTANYFENLNTILQTILNDHSDAS
ncbi:glycosyltransferase [Acinetobacter larvae]|uniref:Glycosyl transferase family 1 domain-containing protein n=1 Tax=Acinetobacter larvae TaxID=1789224 RepID=A0A1B2LWY4_9GAMM|nr:glycosyltransferase [Acinetobacter larvae]AOA57472.1 hypothetical protein BFG52_03295 [Acinetobacter larvae]